MSKYKCDNVGNCEFAMMNKEFELENGEEKCPSCGNAKINAVESNNRKPTSTGGKFPSISLVLGVAALAIVGGGAYFFMKPEPKKIIAETTVPAEAKTPTSASSSNANGVSPSGLMPSDQETQKARKQSDQDVVSGNASAAEQASNHAISNELIKSGISEMQQGKLAEAEKDFADAKERSPKNALVYYNLAILRMKQGSKDEALKELHTSFENGFSYFKELDRDPDFKMLRSDNRFEELVKKYRK